MTNADLCPECAHPLSEHPNGLACCPFCRENAHLEMNPRYDRVTMYRVTCNAINDNHSLSEWYTTADTAIYRWNTRAHPSPWLNAPIPGEGETQTLEVTDDGKWVISFSEWNVDGWPRGGNGGPSGKWARTMRDGKLIYEGAKT